MDVHLSQRLVARIRKFVGRTRGHDNNLACVRLKRDGTYSKGRQTFLDDEYFLVGMFVQPHTATRRHIDPDEGDVGILIHGSLKFVGVPIIRQGIPIENSTFYWLLHIFPYPPLTAWIILRESRLDSQEDYVVTPYRRFAMTQ
jgi:hypothetical protein